jgi:hypothetical protein
VLRGQSAEVHGSPFSCVDTGERLANEKKPARSPRASGSVELALVEPGDVLLEEGVNVLRDPDIHAALVSKPKTSVAAE